MIGTPSVPDPQRLTPNDNGQDNNTTTTGLVAVSPLIAAGEKTLLLIATGQSNAGNWQGPALHSFSNAKVQMLSPLNGMIYTAVEPMLGSDGGLSSVVALVADGLISAGNCARVIVAMGAAGGTSIAQHTPGNPSNYQAHITNAVSRFRSMGLLSQCVQSAIWIQGENDAQTATTQSQYQAMLNQVWQPAFDMGWTGKVTVALCTWSSGSLQANSAAIRAAQAAVVDGIKFVAGPDIDAYNNSYRRDTTHLNNSGQAFVSAEYVNNYIGPHI